MMRIVRVALVTALLTAAIPAAAALAKPANPFVGSWQALDADGSHITLRIAASGRFSMSDDFNQRCQGPWMWTGRGEFEDPGFVASGTTRCLPHQILGSPTFGFEYRSATDQVVMLIDGTAYSRVGTG